MKLKDGFVTHEMDGEQIMVATGEARFSGLVRSNATAAFIVECLKKPTTKEEIVAAMLEKYDATAESDNLIINRVAEIAEKREVSMTEVSLAWLMTKVTAPVVGATKLHHIEGAAKAAQLKLTAEEIAYLEEPYVPHKLVGMMTSK